MTLGIAHMDHSGTLMLDYVDEVKPPFSPAAVVARFCEALREYNVTFVTGDRYAGEWAREPFRQQGIGYEVATKPRSELYLSLLPKLTSRSAFLLDNDRLINQLVSLERRTGRTGRDSIDHTPGSHDDIANAVAGAIDCAAESINRPMLVFG